MDQFFDKFAKIPQAQKIAIVAVLCLGVLGGYYGLFYTELESQKEGLRSEKLRLEEERRKYEKLREEFIALQEEIRKLLEEEKELLRVLPTRQELPTLLEAIHAQGDLVGLEIKRFAPGAEVPVQMYYQIPVQMQVGGSYHQVNRFFKNLGDLKRIVSVENLRLSSPAKVGDSLRLSADFTVSTYRFQDRR